MGSPVRPVIEPSHLPQEALAYLATYGAPAKATAGGVGAVAAESTSVQHLPPEAQHYLATYGKATEQPGPMGSGGMGAAESLVQGLFGNFADEIGGAGNAVIDKAMGKPGTLGENYRKYRDLARQVEGAYEQAHPVGHIVAQIAGGALPALATGGLAIGEGTAPLAVRALQGAAGGALGSAVYGAGGATGDVGERLHEGVKAMPAGALLGALFPVAGAAVSDAAQGAKAMLGHNTAGRAVEKVGQYLERAKMAPKDLAQAGTSAATEGTPAIAADLMGDPGRVLLKWATRQPSAKAAEIMQLLNDRNASQYDRVLAGTKSAMNQGFSNIPQTVDALLDQRRATARPLYQAAYGKGPVMTPTLEKALRDPDFAKAIAKGQALKAKHALANPEPVGELTAPASATPSVADVPQTIDLAHATPEDLRGMAAKDPRVLAAKQASRELGDNLTADLYAQVGRTPPARATVRQPAQIEMASIPDNAAAVAPKPMTDQEALYAKLLQMNGGNANAADAAMRALGTTSPVATAGAPKAAEPIPIDVLDYAKRYLDNGIRRGFDAQSTFDHTTATATNGLLSKVLDEVDAQVPEYAKARQAYHSDSRMLDAVELGRQALRMPPDELQAAVAGLTEPEKEMFRAGAMSAFKEKAASVADRSDLSQQVLTNPAMRQRFEAIAPDQSALEQLTALRDKEQNLAKTYFTAKNGSDTFGNFQTNADVAGRVGAGDLAPGLISGRRVASRVLGKAGQALQARSNVKLADEIAPLLGAKVGSPEFDALVKQLEALGKPGARAAKSATRREAGSLLLGALHGTAATSGDQP